MSLWKYKYFVDVVECKSFTKAGKKNFVTQAAISQQILAIEKGIGGRLVERENGELEVTELGRIVYDRAKEMLEIESNMYREIEELMGKVTINIGIDSSINKLCWIKMQEMVERYYTEEEFHFSKIDQITGSYLLSENVLDFFIGYGILPQHKEMDIGEMELWKSRIGVYLGKNTTIRHDAELSVNDLKGHRRFGTKLYPCSVPEIPVGELGQVCGAAELVDNIEIMKVKVESEDSYAFVDSHYFGDDGEDFPVLEDYELPCIIKVFYKKNRNRKKIQEVLGNMQNIVKNK